MDFAQMKIFINGWKAQSIPTSGKSLPPDPPAEPVLSPTHSMSGSTETFNIGSSPSDPMKRLSKRRTSGTIDLKKDVIRNIQDAANARMGLGIPLPTQTNSRGPSLISVKSDLSPVGNDSRNAVDLTAAFSSNVPALSLIEYWYLLRNQQFGIDNSSRANFGKGLMIFERSSEVGLIIRANPKFNIQEDIWCLFYVEDAINYFLEQLRRSTEAMNSLQMSFGAFLVHLLPQTRILFQYLQHEQAYQQVNMRQMHNPFQLNSLASGITVSYYAHRTEGTNSFNPLQTVSETGPPSALNNSQYRTIGTLDQNFQQILAKFANDCYFHDINLL